jgi:hypothetical protein
MLLLFIAGLFASNTLLKNELKRLDKNDRYWNFVRILEQPFSHLKITGGNITNIAFEPNPQPSVRVSKDWIASDTGKDWPIQASVQNDTLFLNVPNTYKTLSDKNWLRYNVIVRVFSPQLLSVNGMDTKFEMFKMHQKSISVNMAGKSEFELESMIQQLDTLRLEMRDSSAIVFEMSPDFKKSSFFHIKSVDARLQGTSILGLGFAQIDSLALAIADSSAVVISGGALSKR